MKSRKSKSEVNHLKCPWEVAKQGPRPHKRRTTPPERNQTVLPGKFEEPSEREF